MGACNSIDEPNIVDEESSSSICLREPKRVVEPVRPKTVMIKHIWDNVDGYRTEIVSVGEDKTRKAKSSVHLNRNIRDETLKKTSSAKPQKKSFKRDSYSESYYSDMYDFDDYSYSSSSDYIQVSTKKIEENITASLERNKPIVAVH